MRNSSSGGVRIERVSSIELEPRTLTLGQLQYAREEALFILSTKSSDEAISIFTEGLKPVLSITSKGIMEEENEISQLPFKKVGSSTLFEGKRDIVSAPF